MDTFDSKDNFCQAYVQFEDNTTNIKNFGFKLIPIDLTKDHISCLDTAKTSIILSATLYDGTQRNSYITQELSRNFSGEKVFIEPIKSPFDYQKQRKIIVPQLNIENDSHER